MATGKARSEGWLLVGRRAGIDTSPLLDAVSALNDAGIETLTIDLPSRDSAAADYVRAAAERVRRELADGLPVAYLGQGKAAAAGWTASLSGELDGVIAWNGRIGTAWSKLRHVPVPSLLVVDESESMLPWNLFVARAVSRQLDRAEVKAVSSPQDEIDLLASWYFDRILSPSPLAPPAGVERGRAKRRVATIGAAAALTVPCVAAATVQAGTASAALPNFGAGQKLSAADIAGDNAAFAPRAPHTRKPEKNILKTGEIHGDNLNPFATGSQALIDNAGVKYFINTDITFSTSSSASGAMSEASYTHAVSASTLNGGTDSSTLNDAYDGYQTVCVSNNNAVATCETGNANFEIYNKNGPATTECLGNVSEVNRQVVFPNQTVGSLVLSRKVFVPDNDAFARWINFVKNNGGSPQTVTLVIANNLGSDSNTIITGSSSGDQAAQTTDTWVTTFQNYSGTTSSDPRLGHVFQSAGAPVQLAGINFANGDDNPYWGYTFTVQPGQTRAIVNYAAVQPSKAAAASKAAQLASMSDANQFACMTPTEKSEVANFGVTGIQVTKKLVSNPADPAKFNLKVDGTTYAANVGNNGTTGILAASVGTHTVSETAGTNANLSNYTARIACSDGSAGYGTSLSGVHVTAGAVTQCTITNTRKLFKTWRIDALGVRGPPGSQRGP